jgi:hypothetical protein
MAEQGRFKRDEMFVRGEHFLNSRNSTTFKPNLNLTGERKNQNRDELSQSLYNMKKMNTGSLVLNFFKTP